MEKKRESPPVCDYEGSTYQTTFWVEGKREYEDQVEAIALRRLLPTSGNRLLEVGAGAGRNTPRYEGFEQIVLLDYSITQLKQAQARLGKNKRYVFVAADAYKLPFVSGLFDTVTMIRVLHHMVEGLKALKQIRKVITPEGTFVLEYANKQNLKAVLRYWTGRQNWNPFSLEPVEFVKLNFNFHPASTQSWLQEAGFHIERQLTVSHFRLGALKRLVPLKLLVSMDSLAQLTGNWWQLSPSVFVRSKAVGESPLAEPGTFFRCLICNGTELLNKGNVLFCANCETRWAIRDGIYDFKSPLNQSD